MLETDKDKVRIYKPDRSLQIKIGVPNLDQVFTKQSVDSAQKVIEDSSDTFRTESAALMDAIVTYFRILQANPSAARDPLNKIVDAAFRMKSQVGLGGYPLASRLAKSLQQHAEKTLREGLSAHALELLDWHVNSLSQFLKLGLKGDGGPTGEAILKELERICPEEDA